MWMIQLTLLFLMPDQFTVHVIPQFNVVVQAVETKPVLYVTTATFHCPPCERLKRDIEAGVFEGIEIRKASSWPSMKGYPSVRFRNSTKTGWLSVSGYDNSTRLFLLKTLLPAKVPEQSSTISLPTVHRLSFQAQVELHNRLHGGGSWTWPGNLTQHLRTVHGVKNLEVEN